MYESDDGTSVRVSCTGVYGVGQWSRDPVFDTMVRCTGVGVDGTGQWNGTGDLWSPVRDRGTGPLTGTTEHEAVRPGESSL